MCCLHTKHAPLHTAFCREVMPMQNRKVTIHAPIYRHPRLENEPVCPKRHKAIPHQFAGFLIRSYSSLPLYHSNFPTLGGCAGELVQDSLDINTSPERAFSYLMLPIMTA